MSILILFSCVENTDSVSNYTNVSLYGRNLKLVDAVLWENNSNTIINQQEYIYKDTLSSKPMVIDTIRGYQSGKDLIQTGNFSLSLYEEGLSLDENLKKIVGKGMNIMFHISSPKIDELVDGNYKGAETQDKFTFFGYVSSVYNSQEKVKPAKITEGDLSIKKLGKEYIVKFNCKTSFGAPLKGEYKGTIEKIGMKQNKIASFKDIKLDGLLKSVMVGAVYRGTVYPPRPLIDDSFEKAFLYTKSGIPFTTKEASYNKDNIDIALFYDDIDNSVVFTAPIAMRKYLGHNKKYTFLDYTKYMLAPSSFTLNDFENLKDLDVKIKDENVKVNLDNFSPFFVYFETGKGVRGVIYVKSFEPPKDTSISPFSGYVIKWKKGASLIIDIKHLKNAVVPYLR